MLSKSKQLFDSWNTESLSYLHWKGNDHLLEALNGETDLDVLLSKKDKARGYLILEKIGFKRFKSQYGAVYPNVEDWLGFDEETGRLLHLHLHFSLVSGHLGIKEYDLPWTEEAIKTRVRDEITGVFIMDPNLELVSLYTRLITKANRKWERKAKRGHFKINYHFAKEIAYVKKRVNWNTVDNILYRYYGDYKKEFLEIAQSDDMSAQQFLRLHKIVTKKLAGSLRYSMLSVFLRRIYYSLVFPLRNKIRNHGGILITRKVANPKESFAVAFIGQDGCGKSTITLEIEKWLNWKIDARRFYLGSGEHYKSLMKWLSFKMSKIKKKKNYQLPKEKGKCSKHEEAKSPKNLKSFIAAILVSWNFLGIARRAYKEVRRADRYMKKGGIPLFDRFPQTQFEGIYDGPKINHYCQQKGINFGIVKWMARKEQGYIDRIQRFQPHLVFKLMLSPEESISRKPFENLEIVTRKHEITQQLQFPNSVVYTVDATQDYQQEIIFIKNQIWKAIMRDQ